MFVIIYSLLLYPALHNDYQSLLTARTLTVLSCPGSNIELRFLKTHDILVLQCALHTTTCVSLSEAKRYDFPLQTSLLLSQGVVRPIWNYCIV